MPDPRALGFTTRATIAVNARPDSIEAVADKLASYVNIHGVVINTGRFDILAWGDFRGSEDLSNFVTNKLARISGLVKHETMVTLKVTKDDFLFEEDKK
ncbi:MAG: Lrp/AsnC family transcriptional regulator [Candidatus Hodarchaeota archaeon]